MSLNITTPAVLFSTISLLMSAYIARFSEIASLMRRLSTEFHNLTLLDQKYLERQVSLLKKRVGYIKGLQLAAILSLFFSASSMFYILLDWSISAKITFVIAVILFVICLVIATVEVYYSIQALQINSKR